jgi:hypothetical protein
VAGDLDRKVQWLVDREEIRELFETLFYLVDNGRRDEAAERCFAVDGVFEFPPIEFRGREALNKFLVNDGEVMDGVVHNLTQIHIEIEGDTATALATLETLMWMKESENRDLNRAPDHHIYVQHHNELRRDPEGWRITRRWLEYRQPFDAGIPRLVELAVQHDAESTN